MRKLGVRVYANGFTHKHARLKRLQRTRRFAVQRDEHDHVCKMPHTDSFYRVTCKTCKTCGTIMSVLAVMTHFTNTTRHKLGVATVARWQVYKLGRLIHRRMTAGTIAAASWVKQCVS